MPSDAKSVRARLYDDQSKVVAELEGQWTEAMRSLSRLSLEDWEDFSLDALGAVHEDIRALSPKLVRAKAALAELRGGLL